MMLPSTMAMRTSASVISTRWHKWTITNASKGVARLKIKRRQLPLPSLSFLFSPSPSPPFLSIPLPLYQIWGLGKLCELPQWCLGWSPSRWTTWCIWAKKNGFADNTVTDFKSKYLQFSGVSESVLVNFLVCRKQEEAIASSRLILATPLNASN